jgi:hypothetical protein
VEGKVKTIYHLSFNICHLSLRDQTRWSTINLLAPNSIPLKTDG